MNALLLDKSSNGILEHLQVVIYDEHVQYAGRPVNDEDHDQNEREDTNPHLGLRAEWHVVYQSFKSAESYCF